MAGEDRVTVQDGGEGITSVDVASGEAGKAVTKPDATDSVEFDGKGGVETSVAGDGTEEPIAAERSAKEGTEDTTKAEGEEDDKEASEKEEGTEDAPEPLPEWDPASEEVSKKYDERYFKEGGEELNMAAFSDEIAANVAKEDGKPVLNEGTYGWLKDRMGVSKEYADKIIEGQIALRQQAEDAFYSKVGGKEAYAAKTAWASANYTDAQKARHNKAMQAGGDEAEEAIELLNSRFAASGQKVPGVKREGEGQSQGLPKGVQKRKGVPERSTSSAATGDGSGAEPFKNNDEHRAAMKAAGDDKEQQALVRKRLLASPWFRKG